MRTKSYFYSERQNKLIEKIALGDGKFAKKAETLARQINRPKASIMQKITKIRAAHGIKKDKSLPITPKQKLMRIAEGTVINFNNVKKAEMHSDHVRIYF